jgi:hypothetical protein
LTCRAYNEDRIIEISNFIDETIYPSDTIAFTVNKIINPGTWYETGIISVMTLDPDDGVVD